MARIEADLVIDAGRAVVTLGGALDTSNAHRLGALLRRLISEGCTEIVADLSSVPRIDAAAVGILRGAAKAVARNVPSGRLRFSGAPEEVASVLEENGIHRADDGADEATEDESTAAPVTKVVSKPSREGPPRSPRPQGRTTRSRVPRP